MTQRKTIQTLTPFECQALLDELVKPIETRTLARKSRRNSTMALLMLDAGLRVGEVCLLQVEDLFVGSEPVTSIVIKAERAKNNRERQIPVSTRLSQALRVFYATNRPTKHVLGPVYAFYGKKWDIPITTRRVEQIIHAAGRKALNRDVHPHMLRHTFATKLMQRTNIRIVQELLGHTSITSTQIYTHPNSEDLKKAIDSM